MQLFHSVFAKTGCAAYRRPAQTEPFTPAPITRILGLSFSMSFGMPVFGLPNLIQCRIHFFQEACKFPEAIWVLVRDCKGLNGNGPFMEGLKQIRRHR